MIVTVVPPADGAPSLAEGAVLMVLGLLATALGVLWAIDFGGLVTRRHDRQRADRARLPVLVRRLAPPPARPAVQRLTGVLLAAVGCVFVLSGAWTACGVGVG